MQQIVGIDHIGLRVADLEQAKQFYEKLGFELTDGPLGPEPVAIMEHPSGVILNLILNANSENRLNVLMDYSEKHPGYTHVALRVSDANDMRQSLETQGISLSEGPVELPGGRSLFVRDQDRNVVEFHEPY